MTRAMAVFAVAMVAGMLPSTPASAAPTIQLLNPSSYSATTRISSKEDANGDTSYHLVAWVGEVPANPFVEFELSASPIGGGEDPTTIATINGTRVGTTDTFEGSLSTVSIPDGQYFLRAILYSGFLGPGTGQEVARDQMPVTIQSSQASAINTAELAYPDNGGGLGFWKNGDRAPVSVLSGFASDGTNQVRASYTTTAPGNEPEWTDCGYSPVTDEGTFRVRCTLADGVGSTSVRAVAVAANTTPPPAPATRSADESGDAHRVFPYVQNPSSITLDPDSQTVEQGECTEVVATARDQFGEPIATLNIDVHAQGPSDQLRFATKQVAGINQHSPFQAPDAAHSGNEGTAKCAASDPENRQGDHNVPGGNDIKHIESTSGTANSGTNNAGQFTFFLIVGDRGGTQLTVWGDENDDDNLNDGSEAAGYGQLGWGVAPPEPTTTLNIDPSSLTATVNDCEQFTVSARQNGNGQSGENIDIHITGPSGVSFCDPGGGSTSAPDSGGHAGDMDPAPANTRHNEGTTDASGFLVFGVRSSNPGETDVTAWLDENNNDAQESTETIAAASIDWQQEGGRSISIRSSRKAVRKGRTVKLSGHITGSNACANGQRVKIQSRRGGSFRLLKTTSTDGSGDYATKVRVRKTTKYRALAPKQGPCEKATSRAIRVRAT